MHSPLFLFRVFDSKSAEPVRFAAVAPQKIFKTAPARNRMKRVAYEAVRGSMPKLKNGLIIAAFAKATAIDLKTTGLKSDLDAFFVKAGLLR